MQIMEIDINFLKVKLLQLAFRICIGTSHRDIHLFTVLRSRGSYREKVMYEIPNLYGFTQDSGIRRIMIS